MTGVTSPTDDGPRSLVGRTLHGDVLEVGPGHVPFPTAPDARVVYADRSVPGGRDETWPELRGEPWGPEAHLDVNLDVDGLTGVADRSLDAVVACHVLEHLANPVATLREFERVLRPGGRLVLVLPDRHRTFDAVRAPTTFAHLREEYEAGVVEVSDAHVREFCTAIWEQAPIHPEPVRSWHDPAALDAERLELHRRRSIHVHCWEPEEFASSVAATLAEGLARWELDDLYLPDDPTGPSIEFGLVLRRPDDPQGAPDESGTTLGAAERFVARWVELVLADRDRSPARVARFASVLRDDLPAAPGLADRAVEMLADEVAATRSARRELEAARARAEAAELRADAAEAELDALRRSRSHRAARVLAAPARALRRRP